MTVTDTDAPSEVTSDAPALAPPRPATGFAALIGTGEHQRIGRLFVATSFLFGLVTAIAGILVGLERIDTVDFNYLEADTAGQAISLYGVAGVFLFLVPLTLGLAIAIVPAQIGSRSLAFSRGAAVAYWTYLVGGGILVASFVADGGPGGGDADAVALFVASMILVLGALTLGAICVATTVFALRAEGMSLRRVPLFAWANLTGAAITILTFPVLAGVLLLAYVDLRYGPTFIGTAEGLYLRISWVWHQPTVYLYAIPALGVLADVVPVAARTRLRQHRVAMGLVAAFAMFSFGAWAMPSFGPTADAALELTYVDEVPFVAFSFLVLVPLIGLVGLLADTVRRGGIRPVSPLVWTVSSLLMLLAGGICGALVSVDAFDLVNTTATTAQTHFVLGAALLGILGGVVHWAPVLWGRAFQEGASSLLALTGLLGVFLLGVADLVSGFLDQPILLGTPADDVDTIEALNVVALAGGILLALVLVAFLGLLVRTAVSPGDTVRDPWDGHTLEWAGPDEVATIDSEAPLYDARHRPEEDA